MPLEPSSLFLILFTMLFFPLAYTALFASSIPSNCDMVPPVEFDALTLTQVDAAPWWDHVPKYSSRHAKHTQPQASNLTLECGFIV